MDQSGHGAPDASFANAIAEHFGNVGGQVGDEEDDGDHVGEGIQPDHQHHPISENGTGGIGDCVSNENYWPSEIKKIFRVPILKYIVFWLFHLQIWRMIRIGNDFCGTFPLHNVCSLPGIHTAMGFRMISVQESPKTERDQGQHNQQVVDPGPA